MLLEQTPLFLDHRHRAELQEEVLKAAFRFPRLFDHPIYRSYEQMIVNSPSDFLADRSLSHLKRILCVQFFLQKKIESALRDEKNSRKQLFLKLFRGPTGICVSLVFSSSYTFQKKQLLDALDGLLPGISEIPKSFYLWHSTDFPYYFCYFEVDKLRGNELSTRQMRILEKNLKDQILASSPLTPAVFWPYNKEESHRQIQLLVREISSKEDLPHLSIHFQEQTSSSLEFLIHLVRPKTERTLTLEKLPESLRFFRLTQHVLTSPFLIDVEAFSVKMNSELFDVGATINLLYARRYLVKHLEAIIGPFRDYNGGLFEKQQDHFEMFRLQLSSKVPCFDLFAEKVFYALHPFEKWFYLSLKEVEDLFLVFSELIQDQRPYSSKTTHSGLFTVVKTEQRIDFLRSAKRSAESFSTSAQLTIGNFHYECFSGKITEQIEDFLESRVNEKNTLRIVFQEGSPPTLNPHYSSGDMRCRILSKLLFEGLTRLNDEGKPELAGAIRCDVSPDALTYIFHLRKTHWSNGEKVTAFDYMDTWKWALQDLITHPELLFSIKNARNFREKKCGLEMVGIRALDAETIEIQLEQADPQFLYKLAQPFFFPLFGDYREPKWFNGPYLVQEMKKNGLKLGRNPHFWEAHEISFEQIEVQLIDDIDTIYDLFKQNKIDWIGDPLSILSVKQVQELEQENKLRQKAVPRRFSLHFNTKHPILASVPIRKALSLSLDRSLICRDIFPHSIPSQPASSDQEKALAFFEQGLKELGLSRDIFPTLTFSYSDQTRRNQLAAYLQKTWSETFGIQIDLKKQNWNSFRSQLEKRNFEICGTIQDTIEEDAICFLERFEGANSWNFSQWSHPAYRELLSKAKNDPAIKEKATNILIENVPFTPLFDYVHLYAVHPRLECSYFDAEGCVDFSQGKSLLK